MIRKLGAAVVAVAVIFGAGVAGVGAARAASGDAPYNWGNTSLTEDQVVMVVNEPVSESNNYSILAVQPAATGNTDTRGKWLWCGSMADKNCDPADATKDLLGVPIIPFCSETKSEVCVESLELAPAGGEFKAAKFVGTAKGGLHIPADPATNLIEGSSPSLFESDVVNQSGTGNYAVTVRLSENFNHQTGKFETSSIVAAVTPYKVQSGNYKAMVFDSTAKPEDAYKGSSTVPGCAYIEDGSCGMRQDFTEGTRVRLTLNVPSTMGGWFSGRMKAPNISVSQVNPTVNKITVDSEPVVVPQLAYVKNKADISVEKTYNIGRGGYPGGTFWAVNAGGPGAENVADFVDLFRKSLNDTAVGTETLWNMMTVGGDQGNTCLSDKSKVLGIVTTNSMGYDTTAPKFNGGFLNYNVTGLHYLPGGTEPVQGTYDLVMRSETARCLYGFTKAPISATVSVVGGGDTSVATTVVNEKDGWLKMAAYGFTFSDKTLRVGISQAAAKASVSKTATATCTKGKLVKKVTGPAPKCPAGFKKK